MAHSDAHQPDRIYRGTVDEVFSHRHDIPPGAMLELKVFEPEQQGEEDTRGQTGGSKAARQPKQLNGMGAFRGKLGGTIALLQEKQSEIEREERRF